MATFNHNVLCILFARPGEYCGGQTVLQSLMTVSRSKIPVHHFSGHFLTHLVTDITEHLCRNVTSQFYL